MGVGLGELGSIFGVLPPGNSDLMACADRCSLAAGSAAIQMLESAVSAIGHESFSIFMTAEPGGVALSCSHWLGTR